MMAHFGMHIEELTKKKFDHKKTASPVHVFDELL